MESEIETVQDALTVLYPLNDDHQTYKVYVEVEFYDTSISDTRTDLHPIKEVRWDHNTQRAILVLGDELNERNDEL